MNALLQITANRIGVDAMLVMLGLLVFGAIAAAVIGLGYLLDSRVDIVQERVRRFVVGNHSSQPPLIAAGEAARAKRGSMVDLILKPVAAIAKPTNEAELGRLQSRLNYAGIRGERALFIYLAAKVLLSLSFAGVVIWIVTSRARPLQFAAFFTLVAMTVGFYLPSIWLQNLVEQRQKKINRALPDTLDLLVTCVDSGLGLDAAMNRVAEEIALSAPLLSQEIMQAAFEIRAGSSRGEAFRRLAGRTGVEDIRNLASIVVQTEVFGTSIAKALRIMAESMRIRRMQTAEEKAASVAVKMTIPLIVCIMPSLFAVILGPSVVQIIRVLAPSMAGGK